MLLLEFTIFPENTIIIERLDSLGLFQKILQLFNKSHVPLQIFVHLCLPLIRLPLYIILDLIYITNVYVELL